MINSSASLPTLVARMLHLLDPQDGHRVLEIGTGYNTALLCHRLADRQIASIDIHPVLVAEATDRLAQLGHRPLLVDGDGAAGVPAGAPTTESCPPAPHWERPPRGSTSSPTPARSWHRSPSAVRLPYLPRPHPTRSADTSTVNRPGSWACAPQPAPPHLRTTSSPNPRPDLPSGNTTTRYRWTTARSTTSTSNPGCPYTCHHPPAWSTS
ncbi:MAG: hypothetical protein JO100_04290 [Pseudonocardia sp.]|nr:hypothetical protein [Pseudonocardia sp.]